MTGCAYISPRNIPVLISDIKVTYDGVDQQDITPAKIVAGLKDPPKDSLSIPLTCRKSFILSDRTAIAVAGNASVIREFLTVCRANISAFENEERPMRLIGEVAEQISGRDYNELMVVGAHVMPHERGRAGNLYSLSPGEDVDTLPYLGRCVTIGSGATELLDELRYRDSQISLMPMVEQNSVYKTIHNMCIGMNSNRIISESDDQVSSQSWGNFLEYIYYDAHEMRWRRSDDQLYLFYLWGLIDDGILTSKLLTRFVTYHSHKSNPRVAAFTVLDRHISGVEWQLNDINSLERDPEELGFDLWSKWNPKRIALTGIFRDHDGHMGWITGNLNDTEVDKTEIKIASNSLVIDIPLDIWDKFTESLMGMKGFFYQSITNLNQEEKQRIIWPV